MTMLDHLYVTHWSLAADMRLPLTLPHDASPDRLLGHGSNYSPQFVVLASHASA